MYGDQDDDQQAVYELEDRYAQHNNGGSPEGGKKRKKGKKKPKVNIEPSLSASMQPDLMAGARAAGEESMHSNYEDVRSGHSENRRFFEE